MMWKQLLAIALQVVAINAIVWPLPPLIEEPQANTIELTARPINQAKGLAGPGIGNLPLESAFNGTDLQWYGTVQVGTPPQDFIIVFDTGSADILIPSVACTPANGCDQKAHFDGSKSSTFNNTGKAWRTGFGTGVGVGVGSAATPFCAGTTASDTVTVAGIAALGQPISLINRQTPTLFESTGIQGIFGMSPGALSTSKSATYFQTLIKQGSVKQAIFSLFLSPKKVGKAEITIGGIDQTKFTGNISYPPQNTALPYWNVQFQSITVNGKASNVRGQTAIADSGTSNIIAPFADAKAIYALISPNIKLIDPRGAYGIPCSQIKDLNATITFAFGAGKYTIPSEELSVGEYPGMPGTCQTLINSSKDMNGWIIGGSLMKYYYTVWDVGNKRLGWATVAHSPKIQ
ncbi:acid protease [Microthyrium microscopicum]|uniref:Acid protease n=1 Tax=Microthyrium microscopicum TaxID=703497 RepID=A0A6A6UGH8_9PEZI|nr:acid protease [Microthyrium microscopicum]